VLVSAASMIFISFGQLWAMDKLLTQKRSIAAKYLIGISSVVNQNYLNILLQKIGLCFPRSSAEKP
jgi:hypothetical protein